MNPLRKIYLVMFILLVGTLFVPAVSAFNETFEERDMLGMTYTLPRGSLYSSAPQSNIDVYDIEVYSNIKSIFLNANMEYSSNKETILRPNPYYDMHVTYMIGSTVIGDGHAYYNTLFNKDQEIIGIYLWLEIDNIDVSGYAGRQRIRVVPDSGTLFNGITLSGSYDTASAPTEERPILIGGTDTTKYKYMEGQYSILTEYYWKNSIDTEDGLFIQRVYGDKIYSSSISVYLDDMNIWINDSSFKDFYLPEIVSGTWIIKSPTLVEYSGVFPDEPGEPPEKGVNKTFSVFIKDGNTYEPIDEAEIAFKEYYTGEWLLNKTIYNGYASVTLPTGWYYVYVTSPGYYQPYPVQIVVDENLASSIFRIYPAGESPEPEEPTEFLDLTVSVKNSQTGALIGGSEIGIRRYRDTGFYQNLTLSSGYTTVFLPPGNYEIFAEAQGYYQVYPARITLDEPHENIGVFLQPITPIPEEGNVTLNLWVCYVERGSGQAVGIPYADILISGISGDGIGYSSGSLITDMGGYLTLDIPANTEYIAYAEKPGYLAGSTHFTVFNVSPVKMTIQMIREIPPTVPVVTPSPTIPTLPTPTEPLGFMEQSGKALGDLFGVSLSIGKMMLGVLISLAVGMGTAKNLKGGAPEFCVGFLGAAFLVTMADLIPVGFFVAMLLLMGIYIARAYFLGGENGG